MGRRWFDWAVVCGCFVVGCGGERGAIFVDVKTDLVAGVELHQIEVALFNRAPDQDTVPADLDRVSVAVGDSLVEGARVAEFTPLSTGTWVIRVRLLDAESVALERLAVVDVRGNAAVTLVMSRDCRGVTCATATDLGSLEACVQGACVPATCHEDSADPECLDAPCSSAADCPAGAAACAAPRCEAGVCLLAAEGAACGTHEWCEPETGCAPLAAEELGELAALFSHTPTDGDPGIYVSGPIIDPVEGQSSVAVFQGGPSILAVLVRRSGGVAATHRVGIYDVTDATRKVEIFSDSRSEGDQAGVSFYADGTVRVDSVDSGVAAFGSDFGFYVEVYDAPSSAGGDGSASTVDYTLHTQAPLNPGGAVRSLVYQGNDATRVAIGELSAGVFSDGEWLFAFEDGLAGGGASAADYTDVVILAAGLASGMP
jgi:hypothetical protein